MENNSSSEENVEFADSNGDYISEHINNVDNNSRFQTLNEKPRSSKEQANLVKSEAENYREIYNWTLIPLDGGKDYKSPTIKWKDITSESNINFKRDINIGVVCGEKSGIICLDLDRINDNDDPAKFIDGVNVFNKLIRKYKLPNCPIQKTGRDGRHYIFKYTKEIKHLTSSSCKVELNGIKVKIDLKTNGGYFVVYPSFNRETNGKYEWLENSSPINIDDIPEMPDWLIKLLEVGQINDKYEITESFIKPKTKQKSLTSIQANNIEDNISIGNISRRSHENTSKEYLYDLLDALPNSSWDSYDSWLKLGMII